MGQCWGIAKGFKRCKRPAGERLFCEKHRHQPLFVWLPAIAGLVSSLITIFTFCFPTPVPTPNPFGLPPETIVRMVKDLGITETALGSFFKILKEEKVPIENLDAKLREIAETYKSLQKELASFQEEDPKVQNLKKAVQKALESADFEKTESLIKEARAIDLEAAKNMAAASEKRLLSAAKSSAELGDLYMIQLKYAAAANTFHQTADYLPQGNDLLKAHYLGRWGISALNDGHYVESETPLKDSLGIYENFLDPVHPDIGNASNSLGMSFFFQGKYDQAEPLYKRAITILEASFGPGHPNTIVVKGNLEKMLKNMPK